MQATRIRNVRRARLLIALDVIAQILSSKFEAVHGFLFGETLNDAVRTAHNNFQDDQSAQTMLCDFVKNQACQVCAKGALIVSRIITLNQMTIGQLDRLRSSDKAHELPEFTARLMAEIEVLFEGKSYPWTLNVMSKRGIRRAVDYAKANLDGLTANERLIHIMGLLIKNQGEGVLLHRKGRK